MSVTDKPDDTDNICQENIDNNRALYIFYSSVVGLEFILGLLLNITVIHLFIFKLKFWKSKTIDIFLFNLVLADILLLIGLPVKAYNFQQCSENKIIKKLKKTSVGDKTKLRRAMFLVTSVVLVFAVCFLPYAITRAIQLKNNGLVMKEEKDTVVKVYDGLICLSYLNCLLDPILYCLSSSKFKKLYMSIYLPFLLEKEQPENSDDTADE
ncbi:oxoeicosanoid receptor 1 isoform X2 [Chanodichthys erythropterus]|uniref:oxoeicosanoid receptor 1 isoform X2 n=1 Tax=Chanodichthys erythropterus TaxID=933992 RepID=UPI00351E6893